MRNRSRLVGISTALALVALCSVSTLRSSASEKDTRSQNERPQSEQPQSEQSQRGDRAPEANETVGTRAKLEKEFAATMTNATLAGMWRLIRGDKIGPESAESYTLGEVKKLADGKWLIQARIQYGNKDFTVPVKVDVMWAGDTPTIQVTNWGVPALGVGPYTARVMVYGGFYSGVWFGKDVGGLMSGRVVLAARKEPAASGR